MDDIKIRYGWALRRELKGDEKAIVTFEIWGPVFKDQLIEFNRQFDNLVVNKQVKGVRGVRLGSEIRRKTQAEIKGGRAESRV